MVKNIIFKNIIFRKKDLKYLIHEAFINYGISRSYLLADDIKELGFNYATKAGISISIEDLKIPPSKKDIILSSNLEIMLSDLSYLRGEINTVERFQKVIDTWNKTSETLKDNLVKYFSQTDPLNPIYLMAFSGARGNLSQVRQLVGMRGLMSDPNGQIIDIPIIHNFREGLTITDYIMSAYGARKGVVDTALRTADSGYLTRRLIDVAQDIIVREIDCKTQRSITVQIKANDLTFCEKIIGRTIAERIFIPQLKKKMIEKGEEINQNIANDLINSKIKFIKLNSPLTCESVRSICQKCYGWSLSDGRIVSLGQAIGIIAAQSIGEPGTQLTMRTFHTGGIFTSDASRQIRAKNTGFFSLDPSIQTKDIRTIYGSNIIKVECESLLTIADFKNRKIQVKIPIDTSLFIKNNTFIKIGDLIAELPHKNQQTTKSRKNIIAPHSGEVFVAQNLNNSKILWILSGEVCDIPINTFLNSFQDSRKISKYESLFKFKLKSQTDGFLKTINKNQVNSEIQVIQIFNNLEVFASMPIFYDSLKKNLVLIVTTKIRYILSELPKLSRKDIFPYAERLNTNYFVNSGAQIIIPDNSFFFYDLKTEKRLIKTNGKILIIPIDSYQINKDRPLKIENNTKIKESGTELVSGLYSKTNGFVQIKESNHLFQELQIKPCVSIEFLKSSEKQIETLKKIDKKIFFPGEVIFEDISVNKLSFIEIIKAKNFFYLLIRNIQSFNIAKPIISKKFTLNRINDVKFIRYHNLNFKLNNEEKKQSLFLIREILKIESSISKSVKKVDLNYRFIHMTNFWSPINNNQKRKIYTLFASEKLSKWENLRVYKFNKKPIFYLSLVVEGLIDLENFLPTSLNNENFKFSSTTTNFDYVEKDTLLGTFSLASKNLLNLEKIRKQIKNLPKILLITKNNYHYYNTEFNNFYIKKNEMVNTGDNILPLIKAKNSGQAVEVHPFKLKVHKGLPFFITPSTFLYKKANDFIKQDEILGLIVFNQIVTGDIIQGLPKIEEILEARKSQNSALLNGYPGVVLQTYPRFKPKMLRLLSNYDNKHKLNLIGDKKKHELKREIIVKKNEFLYVGQPLTEGSVNPHNLLITYFSYYLNFVNNYESAYLSLKNIQFLLIGKIQQVYNSQGVTIADKHLEVIIKRMTSKVQIKNGGSSFLLSEEIIELQQIIYINLVLKNSSKSSVTYYPILLGITKASLLADSFISAASFQETTKILTAAAIEGGVDWLRGLKENVIIGKLIPVGGGFQEEIIKGNL